MDVFLADTTRPALTRAVKLNLYALFALFGRAMQMELVQTPAWMHWRTAIPYPWLNGVPAQQPVAAVAPETGCKIYRRLGFEHICQMEHFNWQEPDSPH